ncbi:MAG: bacterial Ig-like protein [Paenibacillus sp.]|nr:bacterial Ig-like protein [Paenibacillus sp.]
MSLSNRRPFCALLCFLLLLSMAPALSPGIASAAIPGSDYTMPDTTVYRFGNVPPGEPAVTLVGDPNAAPKVTTATYGVKIQSTLTAASRTFEFAVSQAGTYMLRLGGMTAADGGTADVSIDGVKLARYGFYSVTGQYPRPDQYIGQLTLAAGVHTITLTVTHKGNVIGNGTGTSMYPARLVLTDLGAVTSSKTRRTYYTDEKLAAARENVQLYDWAAALRNSVLAKADAYVALGYDNLWKLVPLTWRSATTIYGSLSRRKRFRAATIRTN